MQVYEKRPSGLGRELGEHVRREPRAAAFAGARALAGVVLVGLVGLPLGQLWLLLGVGLLGSTFLFVRSAATAAVRRPALVLTGMPKWDGTRRTAWSVEADDVVVVARRLANALDRELGASLTAVDEGSEYRGVGRVEAFSSARPVVIAWGVGGPARLAAAEDVVGVWLRVEATEDGPVTATVLANEGEARQRLVHVAWQT